MNVHFVLSKALGVDVASERINGVMEVDMLNLSRFDRQHVF